jgi:methylmalonyl-CoA mutase C-terminal domain/subunit
MAIRVVLAKPGLDGHESGILLVARALRDAGMEVVYLGMRQSAVSIARAVAAEDASVLGLSVLTGGHLVHTYSVQRELERVGCGDVRLVVGGIVPEPDEKKLLEMGVAAVFKPGADLASIVDTIKELAPIGGDRDEI